jgi:hypothetical protein
MWWRRDINPKGRKPVRKRKQIFENTSGVPGLPRRLGKYTASNRIGMTCRMEHAAGDVSGAQPLDDGADARGLQVREAGDERTSGNARPDGGRTTR